MVRYIYILGAGIFLCVMSIFCMLFFAKDNYIYRYEYKYNISFWGKYVSSQKDIIFEQLLLWKGTTAPPDISANNLETLLYDEGAALKRLRIKIAGKVIHSDNVDVNEILELGGKIYNENNDIFRFTLSDLKEPFSKYSLSCIVVKRQIVFLSCRNADINATEKVFFEFDSIKLSHPCSLKEVNGQLGEPLKRNLQRKI